MKDLSLSYLTIYSFGQCGFLLWLLFLPDPISLNPILWIQILSRFDSSANFQSIANVPRFLDPSLLSEKKILRVLYFIYF